MLLPLRCKGLMIGANRGAPERTILCGHSFWSRPRASPVLVWEMVLHKRAVPDFAAFVESKGGSLETLDVRREPSDHTFVLGIAGGGMVAKDAETTCSPVRREEEAWKPCNHYLDGVVC